MRKRKHPDTFAGFRAMVLGLLAFWLIAFAGIWYCTADAAGRAVYLESEEDLGNGFKLCVYSEGVVITIPSHGLCPISTDI